MINDILTGLPFAKKPTRRGRRRAKNGGDHFAHMREAHSHAKNGDHKSAKASLFKAIKALKTDEPEMEHNAAEEMREPQAAPKLAKPPLSKSPAMLALLARRKKA